MKEKKKENKEEKEKEKQHHRCHLPLSANICPDDSSDEQTAVLVAAMVELSSTFMETQLCCQWSMQCMGTLCKITNVFQHVGLN